MNIRFCILNVAFCLFAFAQTAPAQTHPCDAAPQTTAQKGTKVGWCASTKDSDGVVIDVYTFKVFVSNAVVATVTNAVPANATPNAGGLIYFEYSLPTLSRGTRPITVSQTLDGVESPQADPVQWQIGGGPVKPSAARVVR